MNFKLALSSLFILPAATAVGMCLLPGSPCEWYAVHHGQPTFIGTALSDEVVPDVIQRGEHTMHGTVRKVTFRVEEPFEDMPNTTVDVYGYGTVNDFDFQVGTRYLVYAFRGKDGKIRTQKCTRTAPVNEAGDDISFLRSLPIRRHGAIKGLVRFVSPGPQNGTVTGTITESGIDGEHKARVADSGWYEVNGLAPGDYRETYTPDGDTTEFTSLKLRVPVNGSCASSGVRLGNLTVSGKAVNQAGRPIAGMEVLLFYALDGQFHPEVALKTRTNSNGRFSFHHVEAAKYILVAHAQTGAVFFPGVRDASKAQILEVDESNPLSSLTVEIPSVSPSNSR
jgi:hypothetical protein